MYARIRASPNIQLLILPDGHRSHQNPPKPVIAGAMPIPNPVPLGIIGGGGACPANPLPCVSISRPPNPGSISGTSDSFCSFSVSFFARSLTSFSSAATCVPRSVPMRHLYHRAHDVPSRRAIVSAGFCTACRSRSGRVAMTAPRRCPRGGGRSSSRASPRSTPCCRCPQSTTAGPLRSLPKLMTPR